MRLTCAVRAFRTTLVAFVSLGVPISICDKPQDMPAKDGWIIIWANESGNDPSGGTGIGNVGWYQFFDAQVGYKITWDYRESAPPSSSMLTLATPREFINTVDSYVKSFYEGLQIDPTIIDASNTSLLFGIRDILWRGLTVGATVPKGQISQSVAVSFNLTSVIVSSSRYPAKAWVRVDANVLHELGHARGLNARLNDNYIDHDTHSGQGNTTCVMWSPLEDDPPQPFTFCDYHKKVLKNCLTAIQRTYSPDADCAKN